MDAAIYLVACNFVVFVVFKSPSIDRSSSIKGQWIPYPDVETSNKFRSVVLAELSRFEIFERENT